MNMKLVVVTLKICEGVKWLFIHHFVLIPISGIFDGQVFSGDVPAFLFVLATQLIPKTPINCPS